MFVDASAIVAIICMEDASEALAARLDETNGAFTSPIAFFEAVLAVARDHRISVEEASKLVMTFFERARIEVRPIAPSIADAAVQAAARYGKPARHRAQLNMGDCFAYAMAKQHGVPLLYKGDDFAQTDLA